MRSALFWGSHRWGPVLLPLALGRRTMVVGIAQSGQQRFGQGKRLKLGIVIKLCLTAARRFDDNRVLPSSLNVGSLKRLLIIDCQSITL